MNIENREEKRERERFAIDLFSVIGVVVDAKGFSARFVFLLAGWESIKKLNFENFFFFFNSKITLNIIVILKLF